jgi:glycerophosphoryl diester phosphodiesterase
MKNSQPMIIAHRGSSGEFPENTLPAFWDAIQSKADVIEMDLQLTADGQVVVFHDKIIDRIVQKSDGRRISDLVYYELKKIDIGSWFDLKFQGLKIPTLMEVLDSLPVDTSYILELKSNEKELIDSVFQTLDIMNKNLGLGYISVKDINSLNLCREKSSDHKIGLMQKRRNPTEIIEEIIRNEVEIIQIRWREWTTEDWNRLEEVDVIVTAFGADIEEEFKFLAHKNVDGILTNYPKKLYEFLNKK